MSTGNASVALLSEPRLADLSALVRVLAQINRSLDPEDVFKSSLEGIQRVVGGDYGCFLLFQPNTPTVQLAGANGLPSSLREQFRLITLTPKLVTSLDKSDSLGETIAAVGQQVRQVLQAQGQASFVLLPLTARARAIGILFVGVSAGKVLPPLGIDLLMSIGEQIGMAIEHARLHASLAESEEWHRAFIENSPDAFWESGEEGRILYVNDAACRILGYSREEMLKMRRDDFLGLDHSAFEAYSAELYLQGPLVNRNTRIRVKSGEIRTVNFTTRVVRDAQGQITRRQSTFRDVTAQQDLLEKLRRRNEELTALNAIANILRDPRGLAPSLDQVCEQIATITGMETVALYLIDEAGKHLDLLAHRGLSQFMLSQAQRLGLDDPATSIVAIEGKTLALNEVSEFSSAQSLAGPRQEGYHAGIGVPILRRGTPAGVIIVGSKIASRYEQSDVELLQNIGHQVGVALENADLYAQMERRVQELDALAQISGALVTHLDPQYIAEMAVDLTQRLYAVDVVDLSLFQEGVLNRKAARTMRALPPRTEPIVLGEMASRILGRRIPLVVHHLNEDPSAPEMVRRVMSPRGLQSLLAVPLVSHDHTIGTLTVLHSLPRQWAQHEIDLLQTIANQVGHAIENARLYQNALTEQRKVQAIFDSGISGLYATDAAGRIVMFNRAAERITGWTLAEVQGRNWAEILSDRAAGNPLEPLLDDALIRKKSTYAPEGRKMRTRDGRIIPVAKAAAPLLDEKEDVIGAVGAFWDLSKEQRAEIEYENFLAMIAHQLRSPLASVLSALELFERPTLSDEQRGRLWTIIRTEGNQLKKLADQFLDHQALAKSGLPVHFASMSVVTLARRLIRRFQPDPSKHRFRVEAPKPEPLAFADLDRVEHVLGNLLDNAVGYSPEGSLIIVRLKAQDADWVDVSVQDFGVGIPPAEQKNIFQPFYRIPQTSTRRVYGHGLGLALAKDMVTAMGGQIWVESQPENGATFHFTLRRAR